MDILPVELTKIICDYLPLNDIINVRVLSKEINNYMNKYQYLKLIKEDNIEYYVDTRNGQKNGTYKEYYDNGQIWIETTYIDDKKNGTYKYNEWGKLLKEINYLDDKRNGLYRSWYNNGQLAIRCFYIDSKREGNYEEWYNNGQLWKIYFYMNGLLNGEYK